MTMRSATKNYAPSQHALHVCRVCNVQKFRKIRNVTGAGKRRFEDNSGFRWSSANVCPDCSRLYCRSEVSLAEGPKNESVLRGRKAEETAAEYFVMLGFLDAHVVGGPGRPDIIFTDAHGVSKSVEVKKITRNNAENHWAIKAVAPMRRRDDFVAVVTPRDAVVVFKMSDYLAACSSSGKRYVTSEVRAMEAIPAS